MNFSPALIRTVFCCCIAALFFLKKEIGPDARPYKINFANGKISVEARGEAEEMEAENSGDKAAFNEKRLRHEFRMLRNPRTRTIPADFRVKELAAASKIPSRKIHYDPRITGQQGAANQNTYQSIGPNNVAGRARTLAIDRRNANIILTGGVTGGIFRSTDGGASWTFVLNENDIRSANAIVQDPTKPDTWYCGTGEVFYPSSAADIAHGTFGFGIFKSTDNGVNWVKLPATVINNNQHLFDNTYDIVHRLAVHPSNGTVYAAVHNRIVRSKDGGQTWETVLGGKVANTSLNGITEILIAPNGSRLFAAVSGSNEDRSSAGVWESATGDLDSWIRIAGGVSGAADSVAGWQAYKKWSRPVLALNGAANKLFVLYKNSNDAAASDPKPEADLFRYNLSNKTWSNLSAWVPDEPGFDQPGIDPYTTQFSGYNMSVNVKPDNDNILIIGGTALHRVHLNETDATKKFRRIGGYGSGFFPQPENFIYPNHHPDIHLILFPSGNSNQIYTASDGGIHRTNTSILADTVRWDDLNASLQTLQYMTISIIPDPEADFIVGGTQDNGTQINLNPSTQLEHQQIGGGDGATSAVSTFRKTGNTWKQSIFISVVEGRIDRINLTWTLDPNTNNLDLKEPGESSEITPNGLATDEGQWLTLFANDMDSTENLYYNYKNKIFRTNKASTVTSATWTELKGIESSLKTDDEVSAMALSQKSSSGKYLFFGTAAGEVFRFANANSASASAAAVAITPPTMTAGSYVAGIAVNPRNPDTVMAVVSNYDAGGQTVNNIFWTGNATSESPTWQVLDGALAPLSSQSCAIIVKTTGVEYYVGTSVGLYSTTAINGNSTEWFNEGTGMLKKAIVRALANRQRDNTLAVGTHGNGAFIARIGNAINLSINGPVEPPPASSQMFIRMAFPTASENNVQYTVGNMTGINRMYVQIFDMQGRMVLQEMRNYTSGSVSILGLARGQYILRITSEDGKQRFTQKIIRK